MKKHLYEGNYGSVTCIFFFDSLVSRIDVSVEGDYVGEIWDNYIPDSDCGPDEVKKFEDGIEEWLSRNY